MTEHQLINDAAYRALPEDHKTCFVQVYVVMEFTIGKPAKLVELPVHTGAGMKMWKQTKEFPQDGAQRITAERKSQVNDHGRTPEHDATYNVDGQLIEAVEMLIRKDTSDAVWNMFAKPRNWNGDIWLKMLEKPYKERIIIAGALLAAEYDRLEYIKTEL